MSCLKRWGSERIRIWGNSPNSSSCKNLFCFFLGNGVFNPVDLSLFGFVRNGFEVFKYPSNGAEPEVRTLWFDEDLKRIFIERNKVDEPMGTCTF